MDITNEQAKAAIEIIRQELMKRGGMLAFGGRQLANPTAEVVEVVQRAIEEALRS